MSSRPEKLTGATESFEAEAEAEIVNISFVTIFMTAVWKTGRQDGRENVAAGLSCLRISTDLTLSTPTSFGSTGDIGHL